MEDRIERLLEVHKAHIEWLLELACLVHGNVTSAGWQVTLCDPILVHCPTIVLCDPMCHVSSRSGVAGLTAHCCIRIVYFTLLYFAGQTIQETAR